ncbi:MAG: rhomboid family intramembrane serine protease [Candidatus Micrarchaeota archaeon]
MGWIRGFPIGTALLAIAILATYWSLSASTPYITDSSLGDLALKGGNPFSAITHLFVHVGVFHLIGNLIPLILFGIVLESVVLSADVVLIFLMAGVGASVLFSLVNPLTPLIGASGGISGMLTAVMLIRPKAALALLIGTPLLISFVVFPAVDLGGKFYEDKLDEKKYELSKELAVAVTENRTPQAVAQINSSLERTQTQISITQEGKKREAQTPSDFLVHIYGAVIGGFYVYFFKRKELKAAEEEFVGIGAWIFEKADALSARLRGKKR